MQQNPWLFLSESFGTHRPIHYRIHHGRRVESLYEVYEHAMCGVLSWLVNLPSPNVPPPPEIAGLKGLVTIGFPIRPAIKP